MNVWIVNHYAISPRQAGGTRHYFFAKELVKRGHRVTIIASSFDHVARAEAHLMPDERHRLEEAEGVPFLWLRTPRYEGNSFQRVWNMVMFSFRTLFSAGTVLNEKPDIIIGSSPHLFATLAAERLAAKYEIPFVLEVRDLWPDSLVDLGDISPSHPLIVLFAKLEKYLYRKASAIITLLPAAKEHIAKKGGKAEHIVWIPNGIDTSIVPVPKRPDSSGSFTIMYAGTIGLANNLQVLLDAMKIVNTEGYGGIIKARVVGDGPYKKELMERAAADHIENIAFEAPVPKTEIYGLLQEADAFLLLLRDSPVFRWGISPNKLFDYMASARPVVFGVSTNTNPVEKAAAGVTTSPGDPASLAKALIELAEMPAEKRWQMGLRGREYVEAHHSINVLTERLEAVLRETIRRGSA